MKPKTIFMVWLLFFIIIIPSVDVSSASFVYKGVHWDTSGVADNPNGIAVDDLYVYIVDRSDERLYLYYHNGTYTNTYFDLSPTGGPRLAGITMNDTHFWVTAGGDRIYYYYKNGTYTNNYFTTNAAFNTVEDIGLTDDYVIVMEESGGDIGKFYYNGTFVEELDPDGYTMTVYNSYIYVLEWGSRDMYQYDLDFTNKTFVLDPIGERFTRNATHLWTVSYLGKEVYEYYNNTLPTPSTSFTNLGNNLIDHTPTITWTEGADADNDTVTTYIYVGADATSMVFEGSTTNETYNLGTNNTLLDGQTYNYTLRSWDGYEFSDYTVADTFSMNALPSITNVTLTPDPTAVEDDLTANNNTATDADSGPITLYYKWYKNTILQPSLTTAIVNSTNTSNGELWKVGIIPNDGYENGTEVQSQTVEIGSSNSAPTLTGVNMDKPYPLKRYINFTITTENATDVNGDSRKLEVGSATGLSDLGIGDYFTNGNESNITIAMPYYDGLQHTLYIRLNDSNITSQEYQLTLESDITKPVLNSESLSTTSTTQGLTVGITINTTSINSTIPSVTVSVSRPDATSANWTLSNTVNDTWYYNYLSTSDLGTYTVNYFTITDASGNIKTATSSLTFTITAAATTPSGGGGGGGGSGGTTIIQTGDITDLTITPPRLDTYVLYAGFGEDRTLKYRFIVNRNITSCLVDSKEEYNDIATCTITDGYIVDVHLTINDSKGYSGTITVRDSDEFVATSDLIIRVLDIGAYIKIVNIPIGEGLASLLNPFFASANGVLIGIRAWSMVTTVGLLGLFLFKSDIFE